MDEAIQVLAARCDALENRVHIQGQTISGLVSALSAQCGRHDAACSALLGLLTLLGRQSDFLISHEFERVYSGLLQTSTNPDYMSAFEAAREHIDAVVRTYVLTDEDEARHARESVPQTD